MVFGAGPRTNVAVGVPMSRFVTIPSVCPRNAGLPIRVGTMEGREQRKKGEHRYAAGNAMFTMVFGKKNGQ